MNTTASIVGFAFFTAVAAVSADPIRKDLITGGITPCSKVEIRQVYNATTKFAPQKATAYAVIDLPTGSNLKVAAEQCIVTAGAAAGLAAILASPPGAFGAFKVAFDLCAKTKSAELLAAKLSLGVKSTCQWPVAEAPKSNELARPPAFDLGFYIALHDDIRASTGGDLLRSESHWLNFGIPEGRRGSKAFDLKFYLASNADLIQTFGSTNYREAASHYFAYGLSEGRASSLEFDPKFYLSKYEDLRKALGPVGYAAAAEHWATFGIQEGRQGSSSFALNAYLAANTDLSKKFGANGYTAAFDHWVRFGKAEKRPTK